MVVSQQEKKVQGCSIRSDTGCWERTALMPISEASIYTMNCHEGSGCIRIGADVKHLFNSVKAMSTSVFQLKGLAREVTWVKREAT